MLVARNVKFEINNMKQLTVNGHLEVYRACLVLIYEEIIGYTAKYEVKLFF